VALTPWTLARLLKVYIGAHIAEPLRTSRGGRGTQVVGANQPVFRL
jgi:hypothetical protein